MAKRKRRLITIPPKLDQWAAEWAAENDTNVSALIVRLLRRHKRRELLKKSDIIYRELELIA